MIPRQKTPKHNQSNPDNNPSYIKPTDSWMEQSTPISRVELIYLAKHRGLRALGSSGIILEDILDSSKIYTIKPELKTPSIVKDSIVASYANGSNVWSLNNKGEIYNFNPDNNQLIETIYLSPSNWHRQSETDNKDSFRSILPLINPANQINYIVAVSNQTCAIYNLQSRATTVQNISEAQRSLTGSPMEGDGINILRPGPSAETFIVGRSDRLSKPTNETPIIFNHRGRAMNRLQIKSYASILSLPTQNKVLVGHNTSPKGVISIFSDFQKVEVQPSRQVDFERFLGRNPKSIDFITSSKDERFIACASGGNYEVVFLDSSSLQPFHLLRIPSNRFDNTGLTGITFTDDDKLIASFSNQIQIHYDISNYLEYFIENQNNQS